VPNLLADRGVWVGLGEHRLNVRRLMYQPLIWLRVVRDDAGGLLAPAYAEDVERLPDPLIDGMRRDVELGRDFLGRQMLVDEP
jgi:hypothetical protein